MGPPRRAPEIHERAYVAVPRLETSRSGLAANGVPHEAGVASWEARVSQFDQLSVPLEHFGVVGLLDFHPLKYRGRERRFLLRVRDVIRRPTSRCELLSTSVGHLGAELWVRVIREVEEGPLCPPLLALKQQWHERTHEKQRGSDSEPAWRGERGESLAHGPVPDLIVVLQRHHEALALEPPRRATLDPLTVGRPFTVVHPGLSQCLRQLIERAIVLVVPVTFASEQGMERVVPVVRPRRVAAVAPGVRRSYVPRSSARTRR